MPVQIINQDITKVVCDAIVNPTDRKYSGRGGTDRAIHLAAGPQLAEACKQLEPLAVGTVVPTDAYGLPARYIFHTVGPVWEGGRTNETVLLRSCYLNALFKACAMGLTSIAFPLISSGTFGFPKDKVLRIALNAISDFTKQLDAELEITICIFNKNAYELEDKELLEDYLRRNRQEKVLAALEMAAEYEEPGMADAPPRAPRRRRGKALEGGQRFTVAAKRSDSVPQEPEKTFASGEPVCTEGAPPEMPMPKKMSAEEPPFPDDLGGWIRRQDDTFAVMLLKLIDKKNMTDVQCYKKANVSKKTFWKINNDPQYRPSKQTVIAFAISLELTLAETEQLLKTVGFSLSHSNLFDMIIEFYIRKGIYDIFEINSALYQYDQVCLGC